MSIRFGTLLSCALILGVGASAARADFSYPDFTNPVDLSLVGSTQVSGAGALLTGDVTNQAGAMWHANAQDLDGGFSTQFRFRMSNPSGADGMAFVIQAIGSTEIGCVGGNPCGSSPTHQGSLLGYEGIPSVAVELDTYMASTQGDPNANHISVHTLGMNPNDADETLASIGSTSNPGIDLNDGVNHQITIEYVPGEMRIFVDATPTPVLVVNLDLAALLGPGPKWVGFTAATGGLTQEHVVGSWSLQGNGVDFVRGDCNNDGGVNLPDVIFLLGYLFPQGAAPTLDCIDACDTNDDGSLNLPDAITFLAALFGTPPTPLPGPAACGVDPTDTDPFDCAGFLGC